MNWVEYKLENDSVIKVPYNKCNVAPITKETLEQLIKVVNASMRQAKILEHIKANYAYKMREQYEKGRADVIEECIKTIVNTPTKVKIEHYRENDVLVDRQNEIIDMLERLKEQRL